jgi:hypothetical protein
MMGTSEKDVVFGKLGSRGVRETIRAMWKTIFFSELA